MQRLIEDTLRAEPKRAKAAKGIKKRYRTEASVREDVVG